MLTGIRRVLLTVAALIVAAAPAFSQTSEVTATGTAFANDRNRACSDALRQAQVQAAQQAIGVRVNEVSVGGVELGFYQAFIESKGVIERFEEIGSPKAEGQQCSRTIRAWVKPIPDEDLKEFVQQIRRVGVLVQEPLPNENPATAALQRALTTEGYQVVDLSRARREVAALVLGEDKHPLLRRYLVDAVVVTEPLQLVSGHVGAEGAAAGVVSRRAGGAARLVFVDQPEVSFDAVESQKAVGPQENVRQLNRKALEVYGDRLAELFTPTLRQHFPPAAVVVTIENAPNFTMFDGIVKSLRSVLGETQVEAGDFSPAASKITIKLPEGKSGREVIGTAASVLEQAGAKIILTSDTRVRARFEAGGPSEEDVVEKETNEESDMIVRLVIIGLVIVVVVLAAALFMQKRKSG